MYYLLIAAVVITDQLVKYKVDSCLEPGQSLTVINDIFNITYVRNTGAAFSIMRDMRSLLIVLPVILIGILIFVYMKYGRKAHFTLRLAISLIIAGGAGNLIDRILRGYVVDMFDLRVWPVFNVADIAVCAGCILLLVYVIFFDKKHPEHSK